jgi:phage I-like protein
MNTERIFLPEEFVTVTPGEPIPLFPIKPIYKGGEMRDAELIQSLRLPHFDPVIKLGSHADDAPAAGHIKRLEVKDGYLWAFPEWTEKGLKAMTDGDFKYNSPEVIWEGGLEDSETGDVIPGPLLVGDALLHMPAMAGTALYNVDPYHDTGGDSMTEDTVTVPVTWLDRLFGSKAEPQPEPEPTPVPPEPTEDYAAEYKAAIEQNELYEAQIAQMTAENERADRVAHFAAELADSPSDEDSELHELLADMPEDTAEKLLIKFKALGAQAEAAGLEEDIGQSADPNEGDPTTAFNAAVEKRANDDGVDYATAAGLVAQDQPELYRAWGGR